MRRPWHRYFALAILFFVALAAVSARDTNRISRAYHTRQIVGVVDQPEGVDIVRRGSAHWHELEYPDIDSAVDNYLRLADETLLLARLTALCESPEDRVVWRSAYAIGRIAELGFFAEGDDWSRARNMLQSLLDSKVEDVRNEAYGAVTKMVRSAARLRSIR
jgi:hypothetical protein